MNTKATPAISELLRAGVAFTQRQFEHHPAAGSYGEEAAEALGVDPHRVFKTLIVIEDQQPRNLAVGIIAVNRHLDLKTMAKVLRVKKLTMAPTATAEKATGYVAGGISPLGQRRKLPTLIDSSALDWATIYVSGGRRGLDVELSARDLAVLTDGKFEDISRRE